jgi:hypothetical protein
MEIGGNVPCDNECETTCYWVLLHTNLVNIFDEELASYLFMNNHSHFETIHNHAFTSYNM